MQIVNTADDIKLPLCEERRRAKVPRTEAVEGHRKEERKELGRLVRGEERRRTKRRGGKREDGRVRVGGFGT